MSRKFYLAYGSNLNVEQMKQRCPGAETYDVGFTLTENGELKLQVAVEMATTNV